MSHIDEIPEWVFREAKRTTIWLRVLFGMALENVQERKPVVVWERRNEY